MDKICQNMFAIHWINWYRQGYMILECVNPTCLHQLNCCLTELGLHFETSVLYTACSNWCLLFLLVNIHTKAVEMTPL